MRRSTFTGVRHAKAESTARPEPTAADAKRFAAMYQHHQREGLQGPPTVATVHAFIAAEVLDAWVPSSIKRTAERVVGMLTK